MNFAWFSAGVILVAVSNADLIYTTLSTNGAGLLSGNLAKLIWKILFLLSRQKAQSRLLNYAGMIITISILTTWILLAWAGYAFIFISDADSIRHGQTNAIATIWEKVYYAGYSLSTLGNGDFYATSAFWRVFTIIVALSGLTMVTIAITYLIQVITAEIEKRQLALHIAVLGGTPQSILLNSWDGKNFQQLENDLSTLTPKILSHSQHHMAYPIIHYFHSNRLRESTSVNLAALDEAVTILLLCIPPEARPSKVALRNIRTALTTYLITLEGDFLYPSEKDLPLPDLESLHRRGIPLLEDHERIIHEYNQLIKRRRMLRSIIEYGGWNWNDLNESKFTRRLEKLQ